MVFLKYIPDKRGHQPKYRNAHISWNNFLEGVSVIFPVHVIGQIAFVCRDRFNGGTENYVFPSPQLGYKRYVIMPPYKGSINWTGFFLRGSLSCVCIQYTLFLSPVDR